jgi:hypothetical protein
MWNILQPKLSIALITGKSRIRCVTFFLCLLQPYSEIRLTDPLGSVKGRIEIEPGAAAFRIAEPSKCEPVLVTIQDEGALISMRSVNRRQGGLW